MKVILLLSISIISLGLQAQENHYVIIDSISIEGNNRLKPIMIEREILFERNSIYPSDDLNEMAKWSENLLMNTKHYLWCKVEWTETTYKHVSVKIKLKEKKIKTLQPLIERGDRNYRQWAMQDYRYKRFNYGLVYNQYKLFDKNQSLKLYFTEGYTRKYGFEYQIPTIDSAGKYGIEWAAAYNARREIWYETYKDQLRFVSFSDKRPYKTFEGSMAFLMNKKNFFYERWEVSFRQVQVTDSLDNSHINKEFLLGPKKQNEIFVRHVYTYDKRDNIYYPLIGNYFKNDLRLGSITSDTTSIELLRESFEAAAYRKFNKKFYASAFFKFYLSSRPLPYIPYQNFKAFGYEDYVRGYEAYVIDGHAFLLSKINLKYAILHNKMISLPGRIFKEKIKIPTGIYANIYGDWGKVYNEQYEGAANVNYNKLINTNLFGYGAGLDFLFFNNKMLRFEYSLNRMGDKNFNLSFNKSF